MFGYGRDPFAEDEARRRRQLRERLEAEAPSVERDVTALASLRGRGWRLGEDDDLDAIEAHAERVANVYPMEFGGDARDLVSGAREAVDAERRRRSLEHERAQERQRNRIRSVRRAAHLVEDAERELAIADAIEDRRDELLPRERVDAIDPASMTAEDLERAAVMDERTADIRERGAAEWTRASATLLRVGGDAFERHAKTAETLAAECSEAAEAYRARARSARDELGRRKSVERMDEDALRARVAELERELAGR